MSKEFEFFLRADLSKYKGLYAAILDDKIVVSGENAKQVWEKCKRKYPDKTPTIAKIPKEETLVFGSMQPLKKEEDGVRVGVLLLKV